jgi:hypothetical protein
MKRHLEWFPTAGAKPWPAPFRAREGADGTVALATVFSGALGFRIGGVSLMPLRLVLADATNDRARVDGNRDDDDSSLSHAWLPEVGS